MRYLSVCSGIEAASVAWHHLGWTPVAFSEIEPFPAAVLAHHYPNVPNYGDMTKHKEWPLEPGSIDLLVGGTPCQSFSVAGLRKGISDPRGGLMLTYLEIAQRLRPRWIVWENVPGVLSSGGGRDFGSFLGALVELGYGVAYRVLDAQWVRTQRHPRAVPQRRRRVFVVGCLGDWERAAAVLFERESVQRDSAKGGEAREKVAGTLAARSGECRNNHEQLVTSHDVAPCLETTCHDYSRADGFTMVAGTLGNRGLRSHTELDGHGAYIPVAFSQNQREEVREVEVPGALAAEPGTHQQTYIAQPVPYDLFQITAPVNRQNRKPGDPCHTLARDNAAHAAVAFHPTQDPISSSESSHALGTGSKGGCATAAVAFAQNQVGEVRTGDVSGTLNTNSNASGRNTPMAAVAPAVHQAMTVRRLTPRECERLQGFPDDWTLIPWRKKPADECPDGPRYKALGNSMAVNCMAWIGERIAAAEELQ